MIGRSFGVRKLAVTVAVVLSSTTLTGCHELYCSFVEGLTGEPLDCSHEAFPDIGVDLPPLPPPPSLPTTTVRPPRSTSTSVATTSTTRRSPTTSRPSSSTSTTVGSTTSTSPTSTTVGDTPSTTMPGALRHRR